MTHQRLAILGAWSVVAAALFATGACGTTRTELAPNDGFERDASADGPECKFQCTIDGRQIVDSCSGEVVETCADGLACGAARCQEPCAASAADQRSNGCEFYFQMPRFSKMFAQGCFAAYIVNTAPRPAEITLEYKGAKLDISKSVYATTDVGTVLSPQEGPIAPGASVILFLEDREADRPRPPIDDYTPCPAFVKPAIVHESELGGTMIGSSFHLASTMPVAISTMYPIGGSASFISSATTLLPVANWGKQHIIVNGWQAGGAGGPGAQIVASEDATEVTILPKQNIQDGPELKGGLADVPTTYRIDKGQFVQIVQQGELTGSVVTSTKPTSIFGGHGCANIPTRAGACDILNQQLPSVEQWGSEYVGVGYRPRLGNEHEPVPYRIVAARDGTRLDYDPMIPPGAPTTLSAGESVIFHSGAGDAFVVRTQDVDHPIYLAAHMSGGDGDFVSGTGGFRHMGDPEFVNVVPSGQYLNAYDFFADPTYSETSLVIVRSKMNGEFKDVSLECAGTLTDFIPIGTRGQYDYRRVDLSRRRGPGEKFGDKTCTTGVVRMRSEGPFTATLWGYDLYCSYAYPGGMAQRRLVLTPLPPIR